jgi:hypothetical protein
MLEGFAVQRRQQRAGQLAQTVLLLTKDTRSVSRLLTCASMQLFEALLKMQVLAHVIVGMLTS